MLQPNAYGARGAVHRWVTAQELTANREKIVGGDGFGVLAAVAECAMSDLVMPEWLAIVYLRRYRAVLHCKVGSWDSEMAFGRPYPKGVQLASKRRKRMNRIRVINAVAAAISREPDRPVDNAFWEEIGALVGEGKTRAQELHAEAVRLGWTISPSDRKARLRGG